MKRTIVIILLLTCLVLTSCDIGIFNSKDVPPGVPSEIGYYLTRPDGWEYDFWIGDSLVGVDLSSYQFEEGTEMSFYDKKASGEGKYVKYSFDCYIDSDSRIYKFVSEIEITDQSVTVFGLDLNSDIGEWKELIERNGMLLRFKEEGNDWFAKGIKENFTICTESLGSDGAGRVIRIALDVSND